MTASPSIFVGIAGGSASGKTTLAKKLANRARPGEVGIIYLDSYYRARDDITLDQRQLINYDHPDAYEFDLLLSHLQLLKSGKSAEIPRYDYALHTRAQGVDIFSPCPIIVVEGILAFYDPRLVQIYDDLIYVDNSEQVRLDRRIERDIRERGRTKESVIDQWHKTVQAAFVDFCLPQKDIARLIVPGVGDFEAVVDELLEHYRQGKCV